MNVLNDITSEFVAEVPECGNPNLCYCIDCTEARVPLQEIFAAWKRIVTNKKVPYEPVLPLRKFCYLYGAWFQEFDLLKMKFNEDIAAILLRYFGAPTAMVVINEYMSGNYKSKFVADCVLTKWYDPLLVWDMAIHDISPFRWAYITRNNLFNIFDQAEQEALMPDIQDSFAKTCLAVNKFEYCNGKKSFKNKVFYISASHVYVPDSNISFEFSVSGQENTSWAGYWQEFDKLFLPSLRN